MPVLVRIGPYRFLCYAIDRSEPPHVHVVRERKKAKFWLDTVRLQSNSGFAEVELRRIQRIIEQNRTLLIEKWNDFFRTAN